LSKEDKVKKNVLNTKHQLINIKIYIIYVRGTKFDGYFAYLINRSTEGSIMQVFTYSCTYITQTGITIYNKHINKFWQQLFHF